MHEGHDLDDGWCHTCRRQVDGRFGSSNEVIATDITEWPRPPDPTPEDVHAAGERIKSIDTSANLAEAKRETHAGHDLDDGWCHTCRRQVDGRFAINAD